MNFNLLNHARADSWHVADTWQDEDRLKQAVNKVQTHAQLNRQLARSPEELATWDRMDAAGPWPTEARWQSAMEGGGGGGGCTGGDPDIPDWLRYGDDEIYEALSTNAKLKPGQVIHWMMQR